MNRPPELIVRAGWLWPGPGRETERDRAIVIADGLIDRIVPWDEFQPPSGAELIGGPGKAVMPGLINGHTHAAMTLFRGLADDLPLMDWLQDHIWPAEAQAVDEEMVYWAGLVGLAEAIRSGTTTLADSYFCQAGAVRAGLQAGVRLIAAHGLIDFPAPGLPDPAKGLETVGRFIDQTEDPAGLVQPALFCHSPYTCGPETIAGAIRLARDKKVLKFIHLAEAAGERPMVRAQRGKDPVTWLDELGFWDSTTVAVHCVHLDQAEIELLVQRGTSLIACPESNMKLASGLPDPVAWLAAGAKVGLGTDGPASNNDLNMFGEIGSLARAAKVKAMDPAVMAAETVLSLASSGGAAALGLPDLGRLAPGRPADLICLDLDQPHLQPVYNLPALLAYSAHGGETTDVVVAGKALMRNRELTTIDLDQALGELAVRAEKLRG